LTAQEQAATAATVVNITNVASTVLNLYDLASTPFPNLVSDHNLLTAVHGSLYYVGLGLKTVDAAIGVLTTAPFGTSPGMTLSTSLSVNTNSGK